MEQDGFGGFRSIKLRK